MYPGIVKMEKMASMYYDLYWVNHNSYIFSLNSTIYYNKNIYSVNILEQKRFNKKNGVNERRKTKKRTIKTRKVTIIASIA